MAIRSRTRARAKLLISLLILMAFLSPLPLLQASRLSFSAGFQEESLKTVDRVRATTKVEIKGAEANVYARLHKGVSALGLEVEVEVEVEVEESARQVPTGPDPLHHNQIPLGP